MSGAAGRLVGAAALVVLLGVLGCGRIGYDAVVDQVLVVGVPSDRLAGPVTMTSPRELAPGTPSLSLREALIIAANHPGTDLVLFDRRVFPPGAPGVITPESPLPDVTGDGTTVDASEAGVVIDGSAVTGPVIRIDADDVVIAGITFRTPGGDAVDVDGGARIDLRDGSIMGPAARGIQLAMCSGVTIERMRLEGSGAELIFVSDCTDVTVRDNFMVIGDKNLLKGVRFERVSESRIVQNIIDPGDAHLVSLSDSSNNVISQNILDRGSVGALLEGESHQNLVFENVVVASTSDGMYVSESATGNTLVNNTFFQCPAPIANGAIDTVEANTLVSDDPAAFVAPATYDFHLVAGSAAIDMGVDMGMDCLPDRPERFLGSAPDLGAVETF